MLPIIERTSPHSAKVAEKLASGGLDPSLARALALRGVECPEVASFRYPLLHFRDLKGIDSMVAQLSEAIAERRMLVIVADYDCDGATACAVGVRGLSALGARVGFVVPNRFAHGYGLTPSVVDLVIERFPDVHAIVTVDNGISSVAGVEHAHARGVKVLVTDHHLPGEVLPDADAIVNPNQPGCEFESKSIAGVGVMYYVVCALRSGLIASGRFPKDGWNPAELLDLVSLGTVADVVRLDENNRWLVSRGLARIRGGHAHPGIAALLEVARREPSHVTTQDFGFAVGPRLNAAGRIDDMSKGIQCLLSDSIEEARDLARELDQLNEQRKAIEKEMREQAISEIDVSSQSGNFTRVVFDPDFHEGVIGIVAGRIKEKDNVPVVAFARGQEDGLIKGSARSVPGVHLRDLLDLVHKRGDGMFVKFGGHAMAAGLTLREDRLDEFRILFESAAREVMDHGLPQKELLVDGGLPPESLEDVSFVDGLSALVWGQGFEEPVWCDEFTLENASLMGADQNHLSLRVNRDGRQFKAVQFFVDGLPDLDPGSPIRMAYRPSVNRFRGRESVDLMILEVQPAV